VDRIDIGYVVETGFLKGIYAARGKKLRMERGDEKF